MSGWVRVGTAADVARRKKVVVDVDGRDILVLAHDGRFFAFDNICIHRQRELAKGVILNGKIVCPGHQWAFDLDTGWESVKEECQPTHPVQLVDDHVEVYVAAVPTVATDQQTVTAWITEWGAEVAAGDMDAARRRFADDVSAFGTHARAVIGLDRLEAEQWSRVWPAIEDFRFLGEGMQILVADDRLMAVAVAGWTSTGFTAEGQRFDRPGRATVVVRREAVDQPWRGVHTHFSLVPGVPQQTHGAPQRVGEAT